MIRTISTTVACALTLHALTVTDAQDEGRDCFRISTAYATYFFQKTGGGFSSLLDADGNDWISHSQASGAAGMYRGIPNLVHPGDVFHPGHDHCTSTVVSISPSKATIKSTSSSEGGWEVAWDFHETHAMLTVNKAARKYWFLYEGTPGGAYSGSEDYWMTPDGQKKSVSTIKNGDLGTAGGVAGEWMVFGDNALGRVLFLWHREDDDLEDRHYPMTPMTVFGFGRESNYLNNLLSGKNSFTLGFVESADIQDIRKALVGIQSGSTATGPFRLPIPRESFSVFPKPAPGVYRDFAGHARTSLLAPDGRRIPHMTHGPGGIVRVAGPPGLYLVTLETENARTSKPVLVVR